jgi:hypothetical protein
MAQFHRRFYQRFRIGTGNQHGGIHLKLKAVKFFPAYNVSKAFPGKAALNKAAKGRKVFLRKRDGASGSKGGTVSVKNFGKEQGSVQPVAFNARRQQSGAFPGKGFADSHAIVPPRQEKEKRGCT